MTGQLHDLLRDIGDEQLPVQVDPATYARGRRAHRRAVLGGVALSLAAVAAVGVGVTGLPLDDRAALPSGEPGRAALPSRVYQVPERLVSFTENGYVWDESVRADSLAIGTTAMAFPVHSFAVVAVSATDGSYRGLQLPGFDDDALFRFRDGVLSLSPDGTRLAYTWNPSATNNEPLGTPARSGVRVADLDTGEVESFLMPSEFGVFAHGLAWSPNGRYLAYNLWTSTTASGAIHGARNFTVERIDTRSGQRVEVDLPSQESAPAVSNTGEVAEVVGGGVRTWLEGRSPETNLVLDTRVAWSVAWSPDGRLAAGMSDSNRPYVLRAGVPDRMRTRLLPDDTHRQSTTRVLGWLGDEIAVLRRTDAGAEVTAIGTSGESRPLITGVGLPGPFEHVTIATGLLDEPTRDFPEPDWPFDWKSERLWLGIAGLCALLLIASSALRRRLGSSGAGSRP